MYEILVNFKLGSQDDPKTYLAGQVVPDDEFSEALVEAKLLPMGRIRKSANPPPKFDIYDKE
jgi:hypothetical protein